MENPLEILEKFSSELLSADALARRTEVVAVVTDEYGNEVALTQDEFDELVAQSIR